jgi:hypothetical protein
MLRGFTVVFCDGRQALALVDASITRLAYGRIIAVYIVNVVNIVNAGIVRCGKASSVRVYVNVFQLFARDTEILVRREIWRCVLLRRILYEVGPL